VIRPFCFFFTDEFGHLAGCIVDRRPIAESNPLVGDPARFIDDDVEFRQFFCPGCGTLIENEIAIARDPILADIIPGSAAGQ